MFPNTLTITTNSKIIIKNNQKSKILTLITIEPLEYLEKNLNYNKTHNRHIIHIPFLLTALCWNRLSFMQLSGLVK